MKQTIAIDMDEVISDALSRFITLYNEEFEANITVAQLSGKKFWDAVPSEHRLRVEEYPRGQYFFKDLPVVENSQTVIKNLIKHYNIFITTATMEYPTSFTDKFEWMEKHFPFINLAQHSFLR